MINRIGPVSYDAVFPLAVLSEEQESGLAAK
jgi:hypothetical protein